MLFSHWTFGVDPSFTVKGSINVEFGVLIINSTYPPSLQALMVGISAGVGTFFEDCAESRRDDE